MLPARRNKVDISVRASFDLKSDIAPSIAPLRASQRGCIDAEDVIDTDQCTSLPILTGNVPGGTEALSPLWQAPHPQECAEQDAEGSSLICPPASRVF